MGEDRRTQKVGNQGSRYVQFSEEKKIVIRQKQRERYAEKKNQLSQKNDEQNGKETGKRHAEPFDEGKNHVLRTKQRRYAYKDKQALIESIMLPSQNNNREAKTILRANEVDYDPGIVINDSRGAKLCSSSNVVDAYGQAYNINNRNRRIVI